VTQFKLIRPCATCPFRKGQGALFAMPRPRLRAIFSAIAFQCHKTVDYSKFEDDMARQGKHPQQCAGLMSILHRAGSDNTIMQVGQRMGYFDPRARAIRGFQLRRPLHEGRAVAIGKRSFGEGEEPAAGARLRLDAWRIAAAA
jgi:hypothetical protein